MRRISVCWKVTYSNCFRDNGVSHCEGDEGLIVTTIPSGNVTEYLHTTTTTSFIVLPKSLNIGNLSSHSTLQENYIKIYKYIQVYINA